MDIIIQIERLCYAKIWGERSLFYDLINNWPGKSGNLKPQGSLCTLLFLLYYASFQKQSPKSYSQKVAVSKIHKILQKTPAMNSCFSVAGHRPSYLQKLNCAACCPWIFEAVISWNTFI